MSLRRGLPALACLAALLACRDDETGVLEPDQLDEPSAEPTARTDTDPTPVAWRDDGRRRYALLIGVQDYPRRPDDTFRPLRGTRNDVDAMLEVLIGRFAFPASHVNVLLDDDATLAGIVAAVQDLATRAQPDDEIVLYFAGHGSRVPDVSGLETDGLDSTLVAFDSRIEGRDGEFDLTDDALHTLVRLLCQDRGAWVTLVTDSCHAGGVGRGPGFAVRSVPRGENPADPAAWPFWPASMPILDDDERAGLPHLERFVHLAACTPRQEAREGIIDGSPRGLFSWALTRALADAQPGDTFHEIGWRCAATVAVHPGGAGQEVWIEGARGRELFGRSFPPVPVGYRARLTPDLDLVIDAGRLDWIGPRTLLDIVDVEGHAVGLAEVVASGIGRASARWREGPILARPEETMRARVRSLPGSAPRLMVQATDATLAAACSDDPWAEVRVGTDFGDYLLERSEDGAVLSTRDGIVVWPREGRPGSLDGLPEGFRRELWFRGLWCLADAKRRGELRDIEVSMRRPSDEILEEMREHRPYFACTPTAITADRVLQLTALPFEQQEAEGACALVSLEIANETLEDVHVYVLLLSENRDVTVLWPDGRDAQLDEDADPLEIPVWVGSDHRGFQLDRAMRDRYLVLATRHSLDVELLRGEARPGNRGGPNAPGLLHLALAGSSARGAGLTDLEKGWGATCLDVFVDDPR